MSIRSIVPTARSSSTGKVVSAREAVRLIRIGDTVAIGGFIGIGLALEVIHELAALFQATDEESAAFGKPRDLTLVFCVSPGDGQSGGANRLAQPGLVKRIIGGHWARVAAPYQLVAREPNEGDNITLAPVARPYRGLSPGKPRPRVRARRDCIVVATDRGNHLQSWASPYNPAFAAEVRVPLTSLAPMPMSDRKIIARRAAMELRANSVVNLGVGVPEGVASVAAEEKIADLMTLTAEPGVIGGIPAGRGAVDAAPKPP